jgi:transposase-like protein
MPDLIKLRAEKQKFAADLDDITRKGARRMLAEALEAEAAGSTARNQERDERGRAQAVRNGRTRRRKSTLGSGTIEVRAPRVDDRRETEDGGRHCFRSQILPPYMRRSPKVAEVLPILYLRGLSTSDFKEVPAALLGEQATGLSLTATARLTAAWDADYKAFQKRDLSERDYVYVWTDGIHFRIRLEEDRLCALMMIGVRPEGTKELIAIENGYRESAESWAGLLRDLRRRRMRAPVLAVGDGALGFWKALRDVWPETRERRCWVHPIANALDKLPKRIHTKAKAALHEIMGAETRKVAQKALTRFEADDRAKYPKAVASPRRDEAELLTFFDFLAQHWVHLRTANVIESPFATVRLRQRVTRGGAPEGPAHGVQDLADGAAAVAASHTRLI